MHKKKKRVHVVDSCNCGCDPEVFRFGSGGMGMFAHGFKDFKKGFKGFAGNYYQDRTNGDLVVTVFAPGILKDTIKIRAKDDRMTLKADRKAELKERLGDLNLVVDLDETVIPNSAKAKYIDGVLSISFPLEDPGFEVTDID